jgi:hypothetical protein
MCRYYVVRLEPAVHVNVNPGRQHAIRPTSTIKVYPSAVVNPAALLAGESNKE